MVHVENRMLLKIMLGQNKISSFFPSVLIPESFTNKHPTEFHLTHTLHFRAKFPYKCIDINILFQGVGGEYPSSLPVLHIGLFLKTIHDMIYTIFLRGKICR